MNLAVRLALIVAAGVTAAPAFAQVTPGPGAPVQVNPGGPSLCNPPTAPPLYLPAALPPAPTPPKCIDTRTNTTTCSTKVFNTYSAALNAHNDLKRARVAEMNAYTRELQKYQHAATDYAQCEQDRVSELLPD
jgi:hypothetical protein